MWCNFLKLKSKAMCSVWMAVWHQNVRLHLSAAQTSPFALTLGDVNVTVYLITGSNVTSTYTWSHTSWTCLVSALLVPTCLTDAVWGQAHSDGRRQEQRRDDIKQEPKQIWLWLHFLLWITKKSSVSGTLGKGESRREADTRGEEQAHRNLERSVIFAQQDRASGSGPLLSLALTPVSVCGVWENRGMCEAFVNAEIQSDTHIVTYAKLLLLSVFTCTGTAMIHWPSLF